jgi:Ni,Fe-hydrogenase III small subunit/formate hydrogenlyase subunit 6/NADH:ubiquinone oxidoreductase subunit I
MFKLLRKTAQTGLVTIDYPKTTARFSKNFRGAPRFKFSAWSNPRLAADVCPTDAISIHETEATRLVTVDYGRCVYCGQCANTDLDGAVEITTQFELAAADRRNLVLTAEYGLDPTGKQTDLRKIHHGYWPVEDTPEGRQRAVRDRIHQVLGRSLAIREVDAGSCNGCEVEITALSNPVYDLERFGIHFVASPRHADMLLVTGPVTRNMELALLKTYRATPDPKVVVAVGACGISGGIFGRNYATLGGVDEVIPVDVFVPGCPPRPQALLHGILLAVGRIGQKSLPQ